MIPEDEEMLELAVVGDVVLEDGEVLDDAWIGIKNGCIVSLSRVPLHAQEVIDVRGMLVMPGAVDAHVHTRSDAEEGLTATTRAAATGGVTTIVDMPFDAPRRPVRTVDVLRAKIRDIEETAVVDVALYATFPPEGGLEEIAGLARAGASGFKVSVYGVDPHRFPRIPDNQLVDAFSEIAHTGLPVAAHQENQEIVDAAIARIRAAGPTQPRQHAESRPPVAEAVAAARLLEFARWTGVRLHMVHGTHPRTFDLIGWHRATGTRVTGETCIQYLTMTEADLCRLGGRAKCNPPLRTFEDVEALWERIERGGIDIVTSDHSPYALARKEMPDIFDAAPGMPGVATLVPVLYSEGVAKGRIQLKRFIDLIAREPARIFGLKGKGRLAVGADADFIVFNPSETHILDEATMNYRVGWSPFHGLEVSGRVQATYLGGQCVYRDGTVLGNPGVGSFVQPEYDLQKDPLPL